MVRAPCCERMGLKKGPWTPEEDQILIGYIQLYGHGNWRALPKQAGLLRCGKSCRLRWTNYLRPDIKRGNFTREEEDTIIKLHEMLGNRWSAIAARLPGRTDNEIKNVWHTHLKKRLKQNQPTKLSDVTKHNNTKYNQEPKKEQEQQSVNCSTAVTSESLVEYRPPLLSPQQESSSDISSVDTNTCTSNVKMESSSSEGYFIEIDENFWSEVLSADNSVMEGDFSAVGDDPEHQFLSTPLAATTIFEPVNSAHSSNLYDNMDFWHNLFAKAGDLPELLEF